MSSGLNFGGAIAHLKRGARVTRAGWSGKGVWLALVRPYTSEIEDADSDFLGFGYTVTESDATGQRWYGMYPVEHCPTPTMQPWIGMKTADNGFVPWLASHTDLLAEDWEVVS